jgi:hypothetical protein
MASHVKQLRIIVKEQQKDSCVNAPETWINVGCKIYGDSLNILQSKFLRHFILNTQKLTTTRILIVV